MEVLVLLFIPSFLLGMYIVRALATKGLHVSDQATVFFGSFLVALFLYSMSKNNIVALYLCFPISAFSLGSLIGLFWKDPPESNETDEKKGED